MRLKKGLRGPSPFSVQEREELPFRIELRGGAELGQHLASDAVDTHARPLRAFAIAWIGDLPEERLWHNPRRAPRHSWRPPRCRKSHRFQAKALRANDRGHPR